MKLHRLTVRDVKGVAERTVEFPDRGVVVIAGPNEIGKSTLLEALDRLLDTKATSQAGRVRELQPLGRDVGPYVEAELTLGDQRLRFAKRWLREPSTTLQVLAPVPEQLSGSRAQERFSELLSGVLDQALWDGLRWAQSTGVDQVGLADSRVLTEALDAATGVDLHAPEGQQLLERVEREYLRYYTPTGRVSGELKEAAAEHLRAQEAAVHAQALLAEGEALVTRHHELRERQAAAQAQIPALIQTVERAKQAWDEVEQVKRQHDDAQAALAHARDRSQHATAAQRHRDHLIAGVDEARTALDAAGHATVEATELWRDAEEASAQATVVSRDTHQAWQQAQQASDQARAVLQRASDVAEHARWARAAEQAAKWREDEQEARARLAQHTVTAEVVAELDQAERDLQVAEAAARAVAAEVDIERLDPDLDISVTGGSSEGSDDTFVVQTDTTVEVPGAVRITVRPAQAGRLAADRLDAALEHQRAVLARAGVPDVETARADQRCRTEAEDDLQRVLARIGDLQHDLGVDVDEIPARLATLAQHLTESEAVAEVPSDPATARAVVQAAGSAERRARLEADHAAARASAATATEADLRSRAQRLDAAQQAATEAVSRAARALELARDETPDGDLAAAATAAHREFARAEATVAVARQALAAADPDGVRARIEAAEAELAEARQHLARVREDTIAVSAQVELISGEGRHEACEHAMLDLQEAADRAMAVYRSARAARTLHESLVKHRDGAHRAYVRPYAEAMQRLGAGLYGDTFTVQVGPDLTIVSRALEGTVVPFDQLSGGAKEQLGVLARLAVASLVDPDHGVPVVLDDALGFTDPDRLHRIGQIFDGPADRAQVIVLTCTPERYASVPGVHTIALGA